MKIISLVFFALCVAGALGAGEKFQKRPDYEWRPHNGLAPWSAIRVHKGECEEPIYIGLGWFKEGLLPSALYGNSSEVVVTAQQKRLSTDKNTMILCSDHPQLYSWVPTTTESFADLKKECELVAGGVENNETMYVGRQIQDGKTLVGKIYKYPSRELVLPANNPHNEIRYKKFEVLTFNCRKNC